MADSAVPEQLRPYAFKPGQSGNLSGRPKGRNAIERLFYKEMAKTVTAGSPNGPEEITKLEKFVRAIVEDVIAGGRGSDGLRKAVLDRIWPEEHKVKVERGADGELTLVLLQDYNDPSVGDQLEDAVDRLKAAHARPVEDAEIVG